MILNNNNLLFENNVEQIWANFIQASIITKKSIKKFFNNLDLATMQKYLSYKNMNKIKAL